MKNPLVCILLGLIAGAAMLAGFALLEVALGNVPDFVSGLKSFRHIFIALVGACGVAWSLWKKGSKDK